MPVKQICMQTDPGGSVTNVGMAPGIPNMGQLAAKCGEHRFKEQPIQTDDCGGYVPWSGGTHGRLDWIRSFTTLFKSLL